MLIPKIQGGLGNMMFQIASTYSIAKQTGHDFGISNIPMPPSIHSKTDYKKNILKKWEKYYTHSNPSRQFTEKNLRFIDLNLIRSVPNDTVLLMNGYFQDDRYLRPHKQEVVELFDLTIEQQILEKYDDIENAYFLHVRRGDYLANPGVNFNLTNYYKRAVEHIGKGIAYIVSNDIDWCKQWDFLKTISHRFIEENDVDTLIIMSKCGLGGIAANSSYSWWGLYLNIDRSNLIIPEIWFLVDHLSQEGYRFKEATVLKLS